MKFLLALILFYASIEFVLSVRVYVSSSGTGTNGNSWNNAYKTIDDAISSIKNQPGSEIWIKGGTYYPQTTNRSDCWILPDVTKIYGGFYGTESSLSARTQPYSTTILDGDIGVVGNNNDNCYHVFTITQYALFDGVLIRNGNANNYGDGTQTQQMGGGIYMTLYDANTLNLTDVSFYNNSAAIGGAIFGQGLQTVVMTRGGFYYNKAVKGTYMGGYGGALYISEQSSVVITGATFQGNVAYYRGGAIYEDYGTNITCYSCTFLNNVATYGNGGAWFAEDRNSQTAGTYPVLYNVTFTSNSAMYYGGAATFLNGVTPSIQLCTFTGNSAQIGGAIAGLYNFILKIYTSNTFVNNVASSLSSSKNLYNGTAPSWTTYDHNVTFSVSSYLSSLWNNRGVTTAYNDNRPKATYTCYVNSENGANCPGPRCSDSSLDGSTWTKAYYQLQYCIDKLNVTGGEIWVAQGSYYPARAASWAGTSNQPGYSFLLSKNISIYGGFSGKGNETSRSQRNWKAFPTYLTCYIPLSGVYCAITVIAEDNCIIDGFIFTNATSSGTTLRRRLSAGEYSLSFDDVISSTSPNRGAGVFSNGTNIIVANSIFLQNYAEKGGGLYCIGYDKKVSSGFQYPTLSNIYFLGNTANSRGGAISADAYCHFRCDYCNFEYNRTPQKGGAIYCDYHSRPVLNNSVFKNNYAWMAGGSIGADGGSYIIMSYPYFFNNSATWEGGNLYAGSHSFNETDGFALVNPTFTDNKCSYGFSDVYLWPDTIITQTNVPTSQPTNVPTSVPTKLPTDIPTSIPTPIPTKAPTTPIPSKPPTTPIPSKPPTTPIPSKPPTTPIPSKPPTTPIPSKSPTKAPTKVPTRKPTRYPTLAPTDSTPMTTSNSTEPSNSNNNDGEATSSISSFISKNLIYTIIGAAVIVLLIAGIISYCCCKKKNAKFNKKDVETLKQNHDFDQAWQPQFSSNQFEIEDGKITTSPHFV